MKSIKKYIPILVILILAISWYSIIDRHTSESNEYDSYVQAARSAMKDDLPDVAVENVKKAWDMNQDADIVFEMADYYINHDMHQMAVTWCSAYAEPLVQDKRLYTYLAGEYYTLKDYEQCIAAMKRAKEASAYSTDLDEIYAKIKYQFDEMHVKAQMVYREVAGYCVFKYDNLYGILDASGNTVLSANYVSIGEMLPVGDKVMAAALDSDNMVWLVDSSGVKRVNVSANISDTSIKIAGVGSYYGGVLPVYDEKGEYSLLNMSTYQPVLQGYEYIGACVNDRIAVKKDGKWMVVNSKGEHLSESTFEDIKVDDYGFAFFKERAFVKTGGKYKMVDLKLEQIGTEQWNDAQVFSSSGSLTCVLNGTEWCFVNTSGEKQFDKTFSRADTFAHGFAPVMYDGKWGYLNEKGEMIENEKFSQLRGFTSFNKALMGEENRFSIISFYFSSALG